MTWMTPRVTAAAACFSLVTMSASWAQGTKAPSEPPAPAQPAAPAKPTGPKAEPPKTPDAPDMQDMMAMMSPGEVHKQMAKKVGEWTTVTKMSMPGQPGMETPGTAKISSILDGRFFVEEASGNMMGMPYTSHKVLGYNNGTKQYEGFWTYSMSTAMMRIIGKSEDGGKTVKYKGTVEEVAGKPSEDVEITVVNTDDDHFTITLKSKNPDGTPGPTMESAYTRKK